MQIESVRFRGQQGTGTQGQGLGSWCLRLGPGREAVEVVLPEQVRAFLSRLCRFLCRVSGSSKILGVSDAACPSYTTRQAQTESWEHPRGCG